jgi:hypothetical protein
MALEGLLFASPIVVLVAAALAALDAFGPRSPFALAAGLVQRIAYPMRPMAQARVAALARAALLVLSAVVLFAGAPKAVGAVVAAPAILDALVDAVVGWCPSCALARSIRGGGRATTDAPPTRVLVVAATGYPPASAILGAIRAMGIESDEARIDEDGAWAWRVRRVPAVVVTDSDDEIAARLEAPREPEAVRSFLAAAGVAAAD